MIYLLAKYTLLFLVATILGFALGYWWSRRRIIDVSDSYATLMDANANSDWSRLWNRLDAIPTSNEPDFSDVNARIDKLNHSVSSIPVIETHAAADLAPINARLASVETSIKSIPIPGTVNLSPVESRLDAIEIELRNLGLRLDQQSTAAEPVYSKAVDEPVILSAALYGDKDDLKQISGVGPKLERLLNSNGVYYFWQVASWNKNDIEFIDDRLDVFRGRIFRDEWVRQAKSLKQDPSAARMPSQ